MADFKTAFLRTLAFEDDPRHPGRVTPEPHGARARLGINSLAHPNLPDEFWIGPYADALELAEKIEEREYWEPLKLDGVNDQSVANKIFDIAVNQGVGTAARMAQKAVNAKTDGQIGPLTLELLNAAAPSPLVAELCELAAARHRKLAIENPDVYGPSLKSWLERDAK